MRNKIYEEKTANDFKQLIDIATKDFGDRTAFTIKDKNKKLHDISFKDFQYDIKALGTALLNMGLVNKKIALVSSPRYEWCTSYFAVATSNNIIVPLDHLVPDVELTTLITNSHADAIIFDLKHLNVIKELYNSNNTSLKCCICMDFLEDEGSILSYSRLLEKGKALLASNDTKYDSVVIDKDKLSILLYTSGTTGNPKAVMLSQYNICSNVSAMTTLIKYEPNDSILLFLPLHHTLACTASFLFCYYVGFRLCFADSLKDIGKNLVEYKISGLVCVPALIDILYKQIIKGIKKQKKYTLCMIMGKVSNFLRIFGIDLRRKFFKEILDNLGGNLRTVIYGSASSDKRKIKFFNTIGIDMVQGYGITETSPVISCESDKYHDAAGSCGYPLYNLQVKIDNPDKSGDGEILVKGPNVMLGYYNNEELTKSSIIDGWYYTGDIGHLDRKGRLFITGRKKDVIVLSNGKNVFPQELEYLLNESDYIVESMIYEENEKICAEIVYSPDYIKSLNMDEKALHDKISEEISAINKNLPIYKYIRKFTLTTVPLIKTTTQKIKRNEELKKINLRNMD